MLRSIGPSRCLAMAALVAGSVCAPAAAQMPSDWVPPELQGVGVTDRRGAELPPDLQFTNHAGETVTLGSFFDGERPVILTPNYYRCPKLCDRIINGLVAGMDDMDWTIGEEFRVVTFSFCPRETVELAEVKRRGYLSMYGRDRREAARDGWDFLVGEQESITKLLRAIGYRIRYDEKSGDYAHASTILFCTPEGRISLYMDDVIFDPDDLRLALVEASEGRIGSPLDQIALFMCFQYDPDSGSYKPVAWKLMRSGALLTMLVLFSGLGLLWYREIKGRNTAARPALDGGAVQ